MSSRRGVTEFIMTVSDSDELTDRELEVEEEEDAATGTSKAPDTPGSTAKARAKKAKRSKKTDFFNDEFAFENTEDRPRVPVVDDEGDTAGRSGKVEVDLKAIIARRRQAEEAAPAESENAAQQVAEEEAHAVHTGESDDDFGSGADDGDDDDEEEETEEQRRRKSEYFADEDTGPAKPLSTAFLSMNISRPILKALTAMKFTTPTPIQAKAIPVALLGKDIVGRAVTGSGKTAAFIIPILERLLYRSRKEPAIRVLVLCPTRELASQCHKVARQLALYTDIVSCLCVGGLSLKVQEAELRKKPDIVIATPGRFIDHVRNSKGVFVDGIEIMVMDEADRMLEEGFAEELNQIISLCPRNRQTMLFSASMTDKIDDLIRLSLQKPVRLMVDAKKSVASNLTQEFIRVRPQREHLRPAMLLSLCLNHFHSRTIIFFRSKAFSHRMRVLFALMGLEASELHGSLSQEQRLQALEDFRNGKSDYLLATDLASRGLDIKGVETVINYEVPQSFDIYLHRVGRTARAGRKGRAITFAVESDRKVAREAVRAAEKQGSRVASRHQNPEELERLHEKLQALEPEIDGIIQDEHEEKKMQQAEMELRKSQNLLDHEDEIKARPARTWFQTDKEKKAAKQKSLTALNGAGTNGKKRGAPSESDTPKTASYKKTKADRSSKSGSAKQDAFLKKKRAKQAKKAKKA